MVATAGEAGEVRDLTLLTHKAWGESPRSSTKMSIEPAKRVIAVRLTVVQMTRLPPAFAGFDGFW